MNEDIGADPERARLQSMCSYQGLFGIASVTTFRLRQCPRLDCTSVHAQDTRECSQGVDVGA
eukprot:2005405-Lingulodinium_polyedra.AAC.1